MGAAQAQREEVSVLLGEAQAERDRAAAQRAEADRVRADAEDALEGAQARADALVDEREKATLASAREVREDAEKEARRILERARGEAQRELADSKAAHDRAVAEGRREGREIERAARAEAQELLRAAREEAAAANELGKELRETIRGISRRFREADSLLAQELDGGRREIGRHGTLEAAGCAAPANAQPAAGARDAPRVSACRQADAGAARARERCRRGCHPRALRAPAGRPPPALRRMSAVGRRRRRRTRCSARAGSRPSSVESSLVLVVVLDLAAAGPDELDVRRAVVESRSPTSPNVEWSSDKASWWCRPSRNRRARSAVRQPARRRTCRCAGGPT